MAQTAPTRAQLTNAAALSQEYDIITAALAIVGGVGFTQTLNLTSSDFSQGATVKVNVPAATLTTMLTNRQTAILAALAALGVTS